MTTVLNALKALFYNRIKLCRLSYLAYKKEEDDAQAKNQGSWLSVLDEAGSKKGQNEYPGHNTDERPDNKWDEWNFCYASGNGEYFKRDDG